MEFEHYTIEELKPGLFAMDDENGDSLYLIVGEEKALLIDTGLMREDIMPMLKSLTDKPIELALTHAHIDHMYHAPEFATVYLHEADIEAWRKGILRVLMLAGFQMFHVPYRKFHTARYTPVTEDDSIDLGGNAIRILNAAGHTPGSSIFIDEKHQCLFTGDAVGNGGASAWMWLPGSLPIGSYRNNLIALQSKLNQYVDFQMLGGHRTNTFPTDDNPQGQPLHMQSISDMITLCDLMLDHRVLPVNTQRMVIFRTLQYQYGDTGMWVRKSKIK